MNTQNQKLHDLRAENKRLKDALRIAVAAMDQMAICLNSDEVMRTASQATVDIYNTLGQHPEQLEDK